jgi:two-component system, NtrC family, sensor histidine kinase HydH
LLDALPPVSDTTSSTFADLLRRRAISRMLSIRLRVVPVIVVIALSFAALSPTPLRLALFGGAVSVLLLVAWADRGGREPSDARLVVNVAVMGVLQLVVMFAAGGVGGPILPGIVLFAVVASLVLRPREAAVLVLGVQLPVVWACAWVHASGALPELYIPAYDGLYQVPGTAGAGPYVVAAFTSFILAAAHVLGRYLRNVVGDLGAELADDRAQALAQNAESVKVISTLSGEIAHELKNPLASIKGLTALVRRDLTGVPAERMDVLRREVDRMQGILDEFLTYSRPLVPLRVERVDLHELAEDVVSLHEGMAAERSVRLELDPSSGVWARCDPRKIRQVIINLLQNAIDASPAGRTVTISVVPDGDGGRLSVRDRGAGIAADVLPRLFSVGMTTKDHGTGLGLVVARGLARQHGGELSLANAEGGGAEATLTLPAAPPEA